MPVKIGGKRNVFPRNRRAVNVAQETLRRVTPMAQEQYDNALQVNGYDSVIYNRLTSGRKCSCSLGKKDSPTILDEEGNASDAHIQSVLTGGSFGVEDYNSHPNPDATSDEIKVLETDGGLKDESLLTIDGDEINPDTTYLDGADEDDDFSFEQDLSSDFSSRCAICYGNGFVGGYSVFNGIRQVYDVTYMELPTNFRRTSHTKDVTVHKLETPYQFELNDPTAYVEFDIVIPRNVISVDSIIVRNNFERLGATIKIKNDLTPTFVDLNEFNILSYANGLPCQIRISGVEIFTHLELQFNSSVKPTYIEYPRLTKTGDLSVLDAIDSVSLIVSPLVPSVQPWDYIADNVFGKIWRVTNSNWFNDRNMNNHGWEVQARLVQEYEMQTTLVFRDKEKKKTTNFNR